MATDSSTERFVKLNDQSLIDHLSTYDQHISFLKYVLKNATKSILITTYNITMETFEIITDLNKLIGRARRRGVKIFIYYNHVHTLDKRIKDFFTRLDIPHVKINIHSKILIMDNKFICIGSHNWLCLSKKYSMCQEGSVVYYGNIATR